MSKQPRQLVLNAFLKRWGHHPAAWRHPSVRGATARPDAEYWIRMAELVEAAKFDAFFLADFIGQGADDPEALSRTHWSYQFEPVTLLSAIAARTRHIGLIATINTNFSQPYATARALASLDLISNGRAGWNVVSSFSTKTGRNFGIAPLEHDARYERAEEYLDLVKDLWDSWDDDTFDLPDREGSRFLDADKAHAVRHDGKHFQSEGLLDIARPIQGYPVIVQAGNSDVGRDFAARVAEMVYASAQSLDVAQAYYADVKSRMAKYNRDPDGLKITPGLSVVVAESADEAHEKFAELQNSIDVKLESRNLMGLDLSAYPVDQPLPENLPLPENGRGRFEQLVALARRENLTIRDLVLRFSVSRGHIQVVGSTKDVADVIEQWFVERGADGFNVVPPLLPGGLEDFVRLVVPELQKRGIFRTEYSGKTLRENMGLQRPRDRSQEQQRRAAS